MLFTVAHVEPYNHPVIGNGFLALKTGPYCTDSLCAEHPASAVQRSAEATPFPSAAATPSPHSHEEAPPKDAANRFDRLGSTQNTLGGLHLAGVFNGLSNHTPSHRARLPALFNYQLALTADAQEADQLFYVGAALDVRAAVFYNRTRLRTTTCEAEIEQRWYAHRLHRHILVHEVQVTSGPAITSHRGRRASGISDAGCKVMLSPLHLGWDDISDLNMTVSEHGTPSLATGCTLQAEVPGFSNVTCVALAWDALPSTLDARANSTQRFLLAARTSLEVVKGQQPPTPKDLAELAVANYTAARSVPANELMSAHTAAWAELWEAGYDFEGNITVARSVNSSLYYILSNVRDDVPLGLSPGGLAIDAYEGHSFWDTETWMYPAISPLYPDIGRSLLQYRLDRVPGAELHAQWQSELGNFGTGSIVP